MDPGLRENPYSSSLVEPARGGYIFTEPDGLRKLVDALRAARWRGELVGMKGAGKSTLLTDICGQLSAEGTTYCRWQIRSDSRLPPKRWLSDARACQVVVIDGAEALLPGLLAAARFATRLTGKGLLVTTHRPVGVGLTVPVSPNPVALATKVAALTDQPVGYLPAEMAEHLQRHSGNAREVLFDLYLQAENQPQPIK